MPPREAAGDVGDVTTMREFLRWATRADRLSDPERTALLSSAHVMPRRKIPAKYVCGAVLAAAWLWAADVSAQPISPMPDDAARTAFQRGMAALQSDRPGDAAPLFEESYRRRPVAVVLYNLALAYRAQGRTIDAVLAFERFLRSPADTVDPARLRSIRAEVDTLRAQLAQIALTVWPTDATVLVDGLPATVEDGVLLLDAGAHTVEFDAAGLQAQRRSETFARGARDRWNIVLTRQPAATSPAVTPALPTVVARPVPPTAAPAVAMVPAHDDGRDLQRVGMETPAASAPPGRPGWVVPVVVAASVVVAAGIGVGVWALTREPALNAPATTTGWTFETIRVPSW